MVSWRGRGGAPLIVGAPLAPFPAAPDDLDRLPVHQSVSDLPPGFVEVTPEGLSGDTKGVGGLFLYKPLEINEPQGLDLFGSEEDDLVRSPAERTKTAKGRPLPDPPADPGPAPSATPTTPATSIPI